MGEAKRRRQSMAERLESAACCIYCGGRRAATTMDHMPPRAIFAGKQRPKGLEFPSCGECNSGTRTTDQIVAMMSRIYPDATKTEDVAEVRKYLQGVANNEPGLLAEMAGTPEWRLEAARRVGPNLHPLYTGGPLVSGHLERFAAKFGFAMHFEVLGHAVRECGGVAARWYSNADVLEGKFPMDAWEMLGPSHTLRQGRFHVSDQFEYAWAASDTGAVGMFLGTFRRSFAVLAFTADDRNFFDELPAPIRLWTPGELAEQSTSAVRAALG